MYKYLPTPILYLNIQVLYEKKKRMEPRTSFINCDNKQY